MGCMSEVWAFGPTERAKVRQATKGDLSNYSISCEEVEKTVGFGGARRVD